MCLSLVTIPCSNLFFSGKKEIEPRKAAKYPGNGAVTFCTGCRSHCGRKKWPHGFCWNKVLNLEEMLNLESFSLVGICVWLENESQFTVLNMAFALEKKSRRNSFLFFLLSDSDEVWTQGCMKARQVSTTKPGPQPLPENPSSQTPLISY